MSAPVLTMSHAGKPVAKLLAGALQFIKDKQAEKGVGRSPGCRGLAGFATHRAAQSPLLLQQIDPPGERRRCSTTKNLQDLRRAELWLEKW
jgi:hypothetical protein